jgi:4-hydroxythreonine-4-phosphate dehydrogenase
VIYGSSKIVSYHKNIIDTDEFLFNGIPPGEKFRTDRINVVNCWTENVNITLGKASEASGQYAIQSLDQAVQDLKNGVVDALVTAPINKQAMKLAKFPFPGHTEYFTQVFQSGDSLMLMVNDDFRIGLVTNHLPLGEVAAEITKERVATKIRILNESLKVDFGIERPTIGVLGLNPHAGDGGVIGSEEEQVIRPAVIEAKKNGIMAMGPFPADGFFGSAQFKKFDGILAMYHDQALIPFKTLSFGNGVNFTAGLPYIRTSPDHGTAYDIAGKNAADPSSFRQALYLSLDIVRRRKEYKELHSDPILTKAKLGKERENAGPLSDRGSNA